MVKYGTVLYIVAPHGITKNAGWVEDKKNSIILHPARGPLDRAGQGHGSKGYTMKRLINGQLANG